MVKPSYAGGAPRTVVPRTEVAMGLRYIGSKARVSEEIIELLGMANDRHRRLVDGFCGTGSVAAAAASKGWDVLVNDTLYSAAVMAAARLVAVEDAQFAEFGGYRKVCNLLNQLVPRPGFIASQYSPLSQEYVGIERRYFTVENAARIDTVRATIQLWHQEGALTSAEHHLLLGDLMVAANQVANIAGTYGCFLRKWTSGASRPLNLMPRSLLGRPISSEMVVGDVLDVDYSEKDVAYFDPPYTKRQYAAYYHILETIAVGDQPNVDGVTGLRPWKHLASDYCYRSRAREALRCLVQLCPAERVLLSYSNEGHVTRDDVETVLDGQGDVTVHTIGNIGRYRPNREAAARGSHVEEYVFEVVRNSLTKAVA